MAANNTTVDQRSCTAEEINMASKTILGVILAGGKSRRMGFGDKFLIYHQGKTLLEHAIAQAVPQVDDLVITTNGPVGRFPAVAYPIIGDSVEAYSGPLAGVISAMIWSSENQPSVQLVASFPADSVMCPGDWVYRCKQRMARYRLSSCCTASPGGPHYTYGLWSVSLLPEMLDRFARGSRSLRAFFDSHPDALEHYPEDSMFSNINTPGDLQALKQDHKPTSTT